MAKLIQQIKKIPKEYFSLNDLKKISQLSAESLKVALNRFVKNKELVRLAHGFYALNVAKMRWDKFACEVYNPSYISFESALSYHNILSQQPIHLTLATTNRTKTIDVLDKNLIYHHLKPKLFWGYKKQGNIFLAEPEKAFLDLAYLSLNGYANFDPEEMNLKLLNKAKLKKYFKRFASKRLEKAVKSARGF